MRTRSRCGIVLACAALMAALMTSASFSAEPPRRLRWLAAGDSFASGQGLPGAPNEGCRRSDVAWPAQAKERARLPLTADGFSFVACAGHTTLGLIGSLKRPDPKDPEPDKDDVTKGGLIEPGKQWNKEAGSFDLVTFSFGGNDTYFREALMRCVSGVADFVPIKGPFNWLKDSLAGCPPDADVRAAIDAVGQYYHVFLRQVASEVVTPGGNVVVVGYPALIEEPTRWRGRDHCSGIRRDDAALIRGWAGHLNATIGQAVKDVDRKISDVRFTFVNVQDGAGRDKGDPNLYESEGSSRRHNLCGTEPWILPLNLQGLLEKLNVFHPTTGGHSATADLVAKVVNGLDWSALGTGSATAAAPPPPTPAASPPSMPPSTSASRPPSTSSSSPSSRKQPQARQQAPQAVTVFDTLGAAPLGEFTCSRNNANGSSWAIQTFAVPSNVRFLASAGVGVGARDAFTIKIRRGVTEIAGTRLGAGVDEVIHVQLGRVPVNPGEVLELWVGDADGWTNGGTRAPSRLFNVVRTQADSYGQGTYRTNNNCPGRAPGAQAFAADMQARLVGWDR